MKISPHASAASIFAVLLLAPRASSSPVYSVNEGSASYLSNYLGGTLSDDFSFSGPLVSINGSGATAALPATQNLHVPFNINLTLVIDDTGNEEGSATANGISYPDVQFVGAGDANINNSSPITLTPGNLTVSVPAFLTGTLTVCSPDHNCVFGGGPFSDVFDVDFALSGTLTVTYAQFNVNSPYALTSAIFTTVPEPAAGLFSLGGLALIGVGVVRSRATFSRRGV